MSDKKWLPILRRIMHQRRTAIQVWEVMALNHFFGRTPINKGSVRKLLSRYYRDGLLDKSVLDGRIVYSNFNLEEDKGGSVNKYFYLDVIIALLVLSIVTSFIYITYFQ